MFIHIDVGGGSVADATLHSLQNISLRWMVREVMKAQCGIQFNEFALARASIPRLIFPGTPIELVPENVARNAVDALQPLHDEIKHGIWWLLELVPLRYAWQDKDGIWHKEFK